MRTGSSGAGRRRAGGGFTYVSLVILVAIIGLVSATALKLGALAQRSRAEQALLDIGTEFSDALQRYADATPAGKPTQPPTLTDLLKDPRFPTVRRHLRKLYVDPITGKAEWGIVYLASQTGVVAIYSLSDDQPVKIGNFPARYQGFEGKSRLSDWKFSATGKPAAGAAAAPPIAPPTEAPPVPEAAPAEPEPPQR